MKKRIFIAIDISDEARRRVADHIENLRREFKELRVGWEREEKLHITLKFLGDTDETQLGKLKKIAEKISSEISTFKLKIADTGVFSSVKNPRVLWIGVLYAHMFRDSWETNKDFAELDRRIENECVKMGFSPAKRKEMTPHLTIARLREPRLSGDLVKTHLEKEFKPVEFEVPEIAIYESKLQPTGSVYSIVSKYKFAKSKL